MKPESLREFKLVLSTVGHTYNLSTTDAMILIDMIEKELDKIRLLITVSECRAFDRAD